MRFVYLITKISPRDSRANSGRICPRLCADRCRGGPRCWSHGEAPPASPQPPPTRPPSWGRGSAPQGPRLYSRAASGGPLPLPPPLATLTPPIPLSPLRGPNRKSVSQSGGRGRSIGSRCAALADGATSASAPPSPRALMGRSAPMPPEAACGRVGAPLARIAPPNPAAPAIALARRHAPRAARCQRRPLDLCIAPRASV